MIVCGTGQGLSVANKLIRLWTSDSGTGTASPWAISNTVATATATSWTTWSDGDTDIHQISHPIIPAGNMQAKINVGCRISLPDGGVFVLEPSGAYRIEDKDARITYQANRIRDFNRYINASDLIEEFIGYLAGLGLTEQEILSVPINVFIAFLIVKASQVDGDTEPVRELQLLNETKQRLSLARAAVPRLPAPEAQSELVRLPSTRTLGPHCKWCGRFIRKARANVGFWFCTLEHAQRRIGGL